MTTSITENRLARETSPYLLQHKTNPVDWWPWGPEALAEAKRTGKPILLSVGYAACHWCHVMAHESFEDPATADLMNSLYVNIKVDREERPDIDAIYMAALHRLEEHGGWPLTMFLDSAARPFWGGTYFPPESRWGKPAFRTVLTEIARIYREEPDKVASNADAIVSMIGAADNCRAASSIGEDLIADVASRITRAVDSRYGGLQGAPKFPQWSIFWLLWRAGIRYDSLPTRKAVERTLVHICQGGIYDHLGGGFARYSVDERWLVPHFEKMLYDNALLIDLMTEVWRETREPLFERRIRETVGWLEREMIAANGAFAASLDADSEGEEGKFYVWTSAEIENVLGPEDAAFFDRNYDVTAGGNFEGHVILNRLRNLEERSEHEEARLATLRQKLLDVRSTRIRPGWDDKVLADWNGLMIAALARAARIFAMPAWLECARQAFAAIEIHMQHTDRLMHAWRLGKTTGTATAADYANMIRAALRLYKETGDEHYLGRARAWTAILDTHYWRADGGGYFQTADDTRDIIVRMLSANDDATPNANGIMVSNLVQLYQLTSDTALIDRAEAILKAFDAAVNRNLAGHCGLLAAALDLLQPTHIAIMADAGDNRGSVLRDAVASVSVPGALEQVGGNPSGASPPGLAGKTVVEAQPTAYVCIGTQCSAPITAPASLIEILKRKRARPGGHAR